MKEYQDLIGKVIIAGAVIVAAMILANAIDAAGTNVGSQIASVLSTIASQIN